MTVGVWTRHGTPAMTVGGGNVCNFEPDPETFCDEIWSFTRELTCTEFG